MPTTGAMIYALETKLEANNASFLASDATSMLAVQMSEGSSMKALKCSFKGWMGLYVVLTGGLLEMDLCDFRGRYAAGQRLALVLNFARCSSKINTARKALGSSQTLQNPIKMTMTLGSAGVDRPGLS